MEFFTSMQRFYNVLDYQAHCVFVDNFWRIVENFLRFFLQVLGEDCNFAVLFIKNTFTPCR